MPAAAVDKRQRIMQIREVMTVLFLAVMGWKDWKKKEISLLLTGAYGIIGLAFSIYAERPLEDWLLPFGVSLMILAVSVLTGGEIGMGDGWIFLALGTMLHTEMYVRMACIGMLIAAVYAGVLLVICKKGRKTEIPLVPFYCLDIWEDYCYESQKRKFYNRGSLRDVACADNGNGSFISFLLCT